jgi:protein TonB
LPGFYGSLGRTIRYPAYAKEHNIQGKEVVTFVVERNGALTNIHIVRGVGGGLDEEAVRAVALSSPWIPGMQSNKPVRVQFTIPISFTLSGD